MDFMRVAVIGGGIGGLTTAIALEQHGWQVELFERDAEPSGAGTALGMWPEALRALDELGLGDQVRKLGQRQTTGAFRRPDGSTIGSLDPREPVYLLSRPSLLQVLRGGIGRSTLHFATPVDEPPSGYDLVVAADGIFSRTRIALFGARYRARYTGSTAWRGWLDDTPTEVFTETWGVGAKFGVTPQEGGRTNWYATTAAAEGAFTPGAELPTLRRLFDGWAAPVRDVLDALTEDRILRHDLYVVPRLPAFVRGNVALIGDAAHAMTPDLGRGACEALVDAVTLAECLGGVADGLGGASGVADGLRGASAVADGLREYDRRRRKPLQRLAVASSVAGRLVRMRPRWLRDTLLRVSLAMGPK
jgi:2-polyprenyl-6-methoxyphenol hydroxylase-like FAD-dependent oxidoreductase